MQSGFIILESGVNHLFQCISLILYIPWHRLVALTFPNYPFNKLLMENEVVMCVQLPLVEDPSLTIAKNVLFIIIYKYMFNQTQVGFE